MACTKQQTKLSSFFKPLKQATNLANEETGKRKASTIEKNTYVREHNDNNQQQLQLFTNIIILHHHDDDNHIIIMMMMVIKFN